MDAAPLVRARRSVVVFGLAAACLLLPLELLVGRSTVGLVSFTVREVALVAALFVVMLRVLHPRTAERLAYLVMVGCVVAAYPAIAAMPIGAAAVELSTTMLVTTAATAFAMGRTGSLVPVLSVALLQVPGMVSILSDQPLLLLGTAQAAALGSCLVVAVHRDRQAVMQSAAEAFKDNLTGLPNRRAASALIEDLLGVQASSSLVLCDVDHFKSINDTYGHNVGDAVLRAVAIVLQSVVRPGDIVARWGGEEFVLVLPRTTQEEAEALAETCCRALQEASDVTASFGVAARVPFCTQASWLAIADQRLYAAKGAGRNRVIGAAGLATLPAPPPPSPAALGPVVKAPSGAPRASRKPAWAAPVAATFN